MNLNDYVYVQLTEAGQKILDDWDNEYSEILQQVGRTVEDYQKTREVGGFLKFQLWNLMRIFGPHIGITRSTPFAGNEIYFKEPK